MVKLAQKLLGVYVLTGIASKEYAGPYVTISYIFAGVICFFTAVCFAEFSARVKDTSGSSYSFVYYSLGELAAYLTGWMLFTGALASTSAISITWSQYLNSLTNNTIKNFTVEHIPWPAIGSPFSTYLDVTALTITTILFLISLLAIEITTIFNNILAVANILLLLVISAAGFIYGDFSNLTNVSYTAGLTGVIKGSSVVLYAFIGFETSTFAINEAVKPGRNIPLSLIISLSIITLTYCGASLSLNLMQPFNQINTDASYPTAFKSVDWMYNVVSIGPIVSLSAILYMSTYSVSRMAFSMSKDGLVFKYLSRIHPKTKIPHLATCTSLVITLILTVLFDVENLIGFANISGFLIYSSIGLGLLVVRYFHKNEIINVNIVGATGINTDSNADTDGLLRVRARTGIVDRIQDYACRYGFFKSRNNALFLIFFIFFQNMALFGILNNLQSDRLISIVSGIGILSNILAVVTLGLFKQTDATTDISFKVRKYKL